MTEQVVDASAVVLLRGGLAVGRLQPRLNHVVLRKHVRGLVRCRLQRAQSAPHAGVEHRDRDAPSGHPTDMQVAGGDLRRVVGFRQMTGAGLHRRVLENA